MFQVKHTLIIKFYNITYQLYWNIRVNIEPDLK